ncbi:MAG TPA: alkaline phosphatase family protein, partial [Gemmataceae bacterium]|nr:alkaline phosphatase family protein [Gemmataceae bacterium]
ARLQAEGAWFTRCYYPYGTTTTGPGHASMLSGTSAYKHGIINNNWHEKGADTYCASHSRYKPVPAVPKMPDDPKDFKQKSGGCPDRLLSETVADVLKRSTTGKGKVFGLSLKDRSAILPTGKRPDGAYWFDRRFGTSTYYADGVHPWVAAFNASGKAEQYLDKLWTRFRPDLDYAALAGPDDGPGEGGGTGQGKVFPHPTNAGKDAISKAYYEALANSPFGNDLLLDFAKTCVVAEELGQDDVPDLLVVSFSSNDLIGHTWGPDSHEVLDVTLRSDALMADFLTFLDAKVGKGNYAMAITADHGICPLVQHSAEAGMDAQQVAPAKLTERCEKHLKDTFGTFGGPKDPKAKTAWVEAFSAPWMYLNARLVDAAKKPRGEVAASLAGFLRSQPEVARVFTREELASTFPEDDLMARRVQRSFYPERSGDVYVVLKPYYLPTKPGDSGTTHGAPYNYDAHVPLVVYGPGVGGGPRTEPTAPQAAATILSRFLAVPPPKDADFPVPTTLE